MVQPVANDTSGVFIVRPITTTVPPFTLPASQARPAGAVEASIEAEHTEACEHRSAAATSRRGEIAGRCVGTIWGSSAGVVEKCATVRVMPALVALFGPKQGIRVPLSDALVVGRGNTAELQLVDAKVSREHCRIRSSNSVLGIEDLASQNGTFVNGEQISGTVTLREGDEIAVGDTLLLVVGDEVEIENARYGTGTLLLTDVSHGHESPAVTREPLRDASLNDIRTLARGLSEARDEQEVACVVLDAIESSLHPRCATLLWCVKRPLDTLSVQRIVPLATRGQEAVPSVSRTLLELARSRGQGVMIEDVLVYREAHGIKSLHLQAPGSVMVVPFGPRPTEPLGYLYVDRSSERPFSPAQLDWLESVGHLAALRLRPAEPAAAATPAEGPIGDSPAFLATLRLAESAARVDSTVLIQGETGTGKEEIARLIHAKSHRHQGPFVAINCGAIAETLAESELFGHEKGAFTGATGTRLGAFENADGGTLFFDEIGELPLSQQVKLLRVLQERAIVRLGSTAARRVDVRMIAATHRDLREEAKAGRFRQDLLYRLDVVQITMPPLRQRPGDIALLARALLSRAASRLGVRNPGLSSQALAALETWDFPGNVRELGNVLERTLVLREFGDPTPVDADDVRAALGTATKSAAPCAGHSGETTLAEAVARVEREHIEAALRRARGVKSHAARLLGISRPTLDKKISELGIDIWE